MKTSLRFSYKNISVFLSFYLFLIINNSTAQYLPDLIYYKFEQNSTATSTPNFANPGVGSNPSTITSHSFGAYGMFDTCLIGTGLSSSGINTGWATNLGTGSWTISMWLNNLPNNTSLYYIFGEVTGSFRCFLGGAAGAGNLILRGTGITDVLITGVSPGPAVVHFVYDSAAINIKAYKNGVLVNTVSQTALNLATGTGFKIGGYSTSAGLNGRMDEFRVYRKALSAADITATWNISVFPEYYNFNTGTSSNGFPFAQASGKAVNSLIRAGEINNPNPVPSVQQITMVHFRMATAGTRTYTNLRILMAQDTLSALTLGSFYNGPFDTVYESVSVSITSFVDQWMSFKLDCPYLYDPSKSLILFVEQCGSTGTGGNVRNSTVSSGLRRVWSVGGCPFVAYTGGDLAMINFGVDVEPVLPMVGTYTVGSQSCTNFRTLSGAVNQLNLRGVAGPVTLLLTDASYPNETFPITINAVTGASTINTITIKPNTGITPTISGSSSTSIIKLNGADYITINGSNSGGTDRSLIIENTNAASGTAGIWISSLGIGQGASNNSIKNCNLKAGSNTVTTYGIFSGGASIGTTGADNDNLQIINNSISKCYYGIYAGGISGGEHSSVIINSNLIGSNTSTDYVLYYGIYTTNFTNSTISQNEIYNLIQNGAKYGIYSAAGSSYNSYSKNKIHDFNDLDGNASINIAIGMAFENSLTDNTIDNNVIYKVFHRYTTTNYWNNSGIRIIGGTNYKIYYNSISMTGTSTRGTNGTYSTCFMIYSAATTNMDLRNNIFYNAVAPLSASYTIYNYCAYVTATSTFSNINYNNYYSTGTRLGYYNGTTCSNFTNWIAVSGQDDYSLNSNPGFTSTTNLVPDLTNPDSWSLSGNGIHIAGITSDILGANRPTDISNGSPDIGAYEFSIPSVEPNTFTIVPSLGLNSILINQRKFVDIYFYSLGTISALNTKFYSGKNPPGVTGYPGAQYMNGYFSISPTGGGSFTYDITYYYSEPQRGTIVNEADIRLSKSDNGGTNWETFTNQGNQPSQYELNTTNNSVKVYGLNSFSIFTNSDNGSPLPVELSSFTSFVNGRDVKLIWVTEKELNNKGFEIQRKDARNQNSEFIQIGYIKSLGNNEKPNTYVFDDIKLNTGKYNYRLKQIDNNGICTYFNLYSIVEIALPKVFNLSQNFPNPFNPVTKIDFDLPFDSRVRIVVYDMLGREVKTLVSGESKQAGFYTIELNAANLASGSYLYRMIANSQNKDYIFTKKMVLVK